MKIILTGSAGMIGRAFNEKFGESIILNVDKRECDLPNFIRFDITKIPEPCHVSSPSLKILDAIPKCDMVFHLAANSRVHESKINPVLAQENFNSAFVMLDICRRFKKPFAFSSSREVFGNCWSAGETTDHSYLSPYALTKGTMEQMIQMFESFYKMRCWTFRFSNVFGRYDFQDRIIPIWIKQMKQDQPVVLYGAKKTFSFTYIDDCVGVVDMILGWNGHGVYNIAGKSVKCVDVFNILKDLLQSKSQLVIKENRSGEPEWGEMKSYKHTWKFMEIGEALAKTVGWYLEKDRWKKVGGNEC